MEDELIKKKFPKCLGCGGTEFLCEMLSKKMKKRGLMRPEYEVYFEMKQGVVKDDSLIMNLPIGDSVPSFTVFSDICLQCGRVCTLKIIEGKAEKKLPSQIQIPGKVMPKMQGYDQPRMS